MILIFQQTCTAFLCNHPTITSFNEEIYSASTFTTSCVGSQTFHRFDRRNANYLPVCMNLQMKPGNNFLASAMDGEEIDLDLLEKEIRAKNQEKVDVNRVMDAFLGSELDTENTNANPGQKLAKSTSTLNNPKKAQSLPSPWNVALAAGSAVGMASLAALHAPLVLSLGAFAATTYVAQRDPIKDEDWMEGDLSGPISRIIGRATLTSIEKTKPVVQTVVRESIKQLQLNSKYEALREENEELKTILNHDNQNFNVNVNGNVNTSTNNSNNGRTTRIDPGTGAVVTKTKSVYDKNGVYTGSSSMGRPGEDEDLMPNIPMTRNRRGRDRGKYP